MIDIRVGVNRITPLNSPEGTLYRREEKKKMSDLEEARNKLITELKNTVEIAERYGFGADEIETDLVKIVEENTKYKLFR